MSLNRHSPALIEQGWIRAIILVIVYTGLSLLWGYYVWSPELWFTVSFVLSFLLVFLFRKVLDRRSFESLGFNPAHFYPDAVIGFAIGTFLVCIGALALYYLNYLRWLDVVYESSDFFISLAVLAMIAFSEELIFRGYVLRNLMKSFGKWTALVISAVLFSIVHYSNLGIPALGLINTLLGGLVLGITYIVTRSLWMPIFLHLSWNFIQGPVLGFRVSGLTFESVLSIESSGPALLTGGAYGFEGSVVCTIILALAFVAGCYLESSKTYE
ncbi:MAG: CPBP family intramembrane metalloprotease [Chitinophagaceae bacterium]|nr:CPBP family intramembrane metalloprotease [Chitinophagaceae bacterium]